MPGYERSGVERLQVKQGLVGLEDEAGPDVAGAYDGVIGSCEEAAIASRASSHRGSGVGAIVRSSKRTGLAHKVYVRPETGLANVVEDARSGA
jgi:hypothetical protein